MEFSTRQLILVAAFIIAVSGTQIYQDRFLIAEQEATTRDVIQLREYVTRLDENAQELRSALIAAEESNSSLADALDEARDRAERLEDKFDDVDDTVDSLERLSQTDPELLKKYSKVSFLNEHYAPSDLRNIPSEYVYNPDRTYQIHSEIWPNLRRLMDDARDDGIDISVISAFRSFGDQSVLKGQYTVLYGAGSANQFSADQGYSEHQLGTTVDFTNDQVGATFSGFAQSETYSWLVNNAYKYGFVLSYPESNAYYQFEPWHWRYVGEKLARDLDDDNDFLYEWSQRDIDEYLIDFFD